MPRTQPEPPPVVQRIDGLQDPVEVEERLAHAHEHDVRQPLPVGGQAARGVADLVDDLGGLEVPGEAELAGRAERTADRAAGLARDAQGVPLALAPASRVVHEDRLDEGPVGQAVEGLLGQAAVGEADLGVADGVEPEGLVELGPEACRQRPDLGRGCRPCRARPRRRPVGPGTPGAPRAANHASSSPAASPEIPGRTEAPATRRAR